jgi:SAM-dependent methyltransferase
MTNADLWDAEAATFDDEPDHGLRDPVVRTAWRRLLTGVMPRPPARIADLGCGTGTLTALLAEQDYTVDGVDFSPGMVRRAQAKAGALPGTNFVVGDAARPPLPESSYDVVLCRPVLWALPDLAAALGRWVDLLQDNGRLVLVEGSWSTGVGLTAAQTVTLVECAGLAATLQRLDDPDYWGGLIDDERYLVVGHRQSEG